jgi:hypothetical protein
MRATAETASDCSIVGFATSLSLGLDTTRLRELPIFSYGTTLTESLPYSACRLKMKMAPDPLFPFDILG